jgi:cytosine/adenosine deaminase-related metal-dependent hydrolase
MQPVPSRGLTLINADLGHVGASTLRILHARIVLIGGAPQPGDVVVDLQGDRLLPGLINAHDHLQLNGFARLKYRNSYRNVREWIADVEAHMQTDRRLRACAAIPREHRLLHGGLKNLLSGVTTVAHHDRLYESLRDADYPTQVVLDYGWSHSLLVDGEDGVRVSHRRTPAGSPWIIHAAEGVDDEASTEFERLDALGCLGANTLLVHGVALNDAQRMRLIASGSGLIWCPSSNLHLFGETTDVAGLMAQGRVALGSDSRLSGEADLLGELRVAHSVGGLDDAKLEALVTVDGARLLRLHDRGVLQAGAVADLLALPSRLPLWAATRADVRLVMAGGVMRYGDRDYARTVAPAQQFVDIGVDGRPKVLACDVAARLLRSGINEAGVEMPQTGWRAA